MVFDIRRGKGACTYVSLLARNKASRLVRADMEIEMDKRILKTLERLTGQVESLQNRIFAIEHKNDQERRVYAAVASAKNKLILASSET